MTKRNNPVLDVKAGEAVTRLDRWFKQRFPGIGHALVQKLVRTGQIRVDGARAKAGTRLEPGQKVRIPPLGPLPAAKPVRAKPAVSGADTREMKALVLHRDDEVIVLDKPAGAGGIDGIDGKALLLKPVLDEFGEPFVILDH